MLHARFLSSERCQEHLRKTPLVAMLYLADDCSEIRCEQGQGIGPAHLIPSALDEPVAMKGLTALQVLIHFNGAILFDECLDLDTLREHCASLCIVIRRDLLLDPRHLYRDKPMQYRISHAHTHLIACP